MDEPKADENPDCIAIVGFGPKGLYALVQLVKRLIKSPADRIVEVHIFEKGSFFGAGEVYRPDQPEYLKMNIPSADVRRYLRQAFAEVPGVTASAYSAMDTYGDFRFMPRAVVGKCLTEGFEGIRASLPPCVRLREYRGEVTGLVREGADCKLQFLAAQDKADSAAEVLPFRYRHILLATGHPGCRPIPHDLLPFCLPAWGPHGKFDGEPCYVPSVYPVGALAASANSDSTVLIRGMGLSFVDAALALTEGRGGRFTEGGTDRFRYIPSGKEPKRIVPFSRSGRLMPARGALHMRCEHELCFFTADFAERLLKRKRGRINFERDLWPSIEAEYLAAYYGRLFEIHGYETPPLAGCSIEKLRGLTVDFHALHGDEPVFDPREYLECMDASLLPEFTNPHRYSLDALAGGIDAAVAGPEVSPRSATVNVWRAISPIFNSLYSAGGLDPSSHEAFDGELNGQLQCLTYGPCTDNMKKMLALAEAGYVDFGSGPGATLSAVPETMELVLHSRYLDNPVKGDVLIEARIPRMALNGHLPPLYAALVAAGELRPFENKADGITYAPGCPDMDADGRAVNAEGHHHAVLSLAGTPTEGFFYDNDTLSPVRNNTVDAWAERVTDILHQNNRHAYTN